MAAAASPYAAPTQTNLSPPLSSFVIVGSAVETAVTSSALRKLETTTAVKESQNVEPVSGRAGGEEGILKLVGGRRKDWTGVCVARRLGLSWE